MTLFGGVLSRGAVTGATDDAAWLTAMLAFEAGLARVLAAEGVVSAEAADAVAATCADPSAFDVDELGREAAASGNPAVPLVAALRARVGGAGAGAVHRGATSQDVLDTAAMLVARDALGVVLADLAGAAAAAATLAERHATTPMAGRTLLQQAVATTFGLKAAGWLMALDAAAARLEDVADTRLAVQLGGAAGTLAPLGAAGPRVVAALARTLELAEPVVPWHTDRTRIADLTAALASACGVAAKVALDLVLLAQTEVAEARPRHGGGSSAMPHKANPVAAISARACAAQAPGLVATLLGAMAHEHERAAGAWHAEWRPLTELLVATGSALSWLRAALEELDVDPEAMRANLGLTGGLLGAERVAGALGDGARELVRAAAAQAVREDRALADVLAADPAVPLDHARLTELTDPAADLGSAPAFVGRALAAHAGRERGTAPRP